jgi:transcriptional regulator with XRE-family HTH domain
MDRRATIRRWLALREREGLTYAQLAARSGLNAATLAHWSWRLRRESRRRSNDTFVELVPAADGVTTSSRSQVVVELRGERRLVVDAAIDSTELTRLVQALERC